MSMKLKWGKWLYALGQTVVGGISSSVIAWLGTVVGGQIDVAVKPLNFKEFGIVLVTSTVFHLFFFLKQSPLPQESTGNTEMFVKPKED